MPSKNNPSVFRASVFRAYIGGEWTDNGSHFLVTGPAHGGFVARVTDCGEDQAKHAIEASVAAFHAWREVAAVERARILRRWSELIVGSKEEIGKTITSEMGKPISESLGETLYAASSVEWYAEEARRTYGEVFSGSEAGKRLYALRQPVGPVYAVTPWNFPAAMMTRKSAAALAAGCTAVIQPAEQSPLTALLLAKLWEEAGGPAGTLQVLPSSRPAEVSRPMLEDARIRKVSFTGSTEAGRMLYEQCAGTIKRASLEQPGQAPFLIYEDADLEAAVSEVMVSKFGNARQTCVCVNRIYVQRSIAEELAEKLADAVLGLRVGDPHIESTQVGPLVDEAAIAKVQEHVRDAVDKGARVLVGGRRSHGLFFEPTVLAGVGNGMRIVSEENLGPIVPLIEFDTDLESVAMANESMANDTAFNERNFGPAAYLWSADLHRAHRISEALECGIVGINEGTLSAAHAPFGSVKDGGPGREGGPWGLNEFLDVKYVSVALRRPLFAPHS